MTVGTIDISTLLAWGPAKRVNTKAGERIVRNAAPTAAFSRMWKENQAALKAAGLGWGKDLSGNWQVVWWSDIPTEERAARCAAVEASRATDMNILIPGPAGLSYLGYQRAGIGFALECFKSGRGCLLGDEMGLGKTIQAIGCINAEASIQRVLVLCPASLKLNWARELSRWLVRPLSVGVAGPKDFPDTQVVILNYDNVEKWNSKLAVGWDLLVVDEAHFLKNPEAKRTQAVLGNKSRAGIPAKRRVVMTGTPIVNRPIELFTLLNALDPAQWSNRFGYAKRYCGAVQKEIPVRGKFGGQREWRKVWDFSGSSNLEELQRKLRETIMVRRLKSEVLKDLPAKRRQVIEVPVDERTAHLVRREEELEETIINLQAQVALAAVCGTADEYAAAVDRLREGETVAFEGMSKLAEAIEVAKVPVVLEHIAAIREEDPDRKLIVFCGHLEVVRQLQAALPGSVVITGEVPVVKRQANVDRFQNDAGCREIIGTIPAMGVGLTLTASSHVIFSALDWVPGNMSQAEDRAHRIGQKDSVLVQHLVLEGSLDAYKASTIVEKQDVIDRALDQGLQVDAGAAGKEVTTTVVIRMFPRVEKQMVTATREVVEAEAPLFTLSQAEAILEGLQAIAGRCDGALEEDGCGFNKFDTRVGKSLAGNEKLTDRECVLGRRLVQKYQRQLRDKTILDRAGIPAMKAK